MLHVILLQELQIPDQRIFVIIIYIHLFIFRNILQHSYDNEKI